MDFENRIFVTWDEAAQMLGTDREGLRQAMLLKHSPNWDEPTESWLPVVISTRLDGFMTRLEWGHRRYPDFQWNDRTTFYRTVGDGLRGSPDAPGLLTFNDGTSIPLRGRADGDRWEATHGYGAAEGVGMTFIVDGDTLVVSPETVRQACRLGYIDSLRIAPRAWCRERFSDDQAFCVVRIGDSLYDEKPDNYFESFRFLREDVVRIRSEPKVSASGRDLRADARQSYERVIAVLWSKVHGDGGPGKVSADPHSAANSIAKVLADNALETPSTDKIGRILASAKGQGIKIGS